MKTNKLSNEEFSLIIHNVPKIVENVKGTAIALVDILYLTKDKGLHKRINDIINKYITYGKTPYLEADRLRPFRLKNGKILMQTVVKINMPKKLADFLINVSKFFGYTEGVHPEPNK